MWPDDGLEIWERDAYAEGMYEKADNNRKAARENGDVTSVARPEAANESETDND